MFKKRTLPLFLIIVCIFHLLTGCTININIGNSDGDSKKETDGKSIFEELFKKEDQTKLYESRAMIYLSSPLINDKFDISETELAVASQLMKDCGVILQSEAIQKQIHEEYPDIEYTLSLEATDETNIGVLIATGKDPEYLEGICNMAIDLLGEKVADLMGLSCNVVECAGPAQEIEAN